MKLYYSKPSPFARKTRVSMLEAGLGTQVEGVVVNPWEDPEGYRDINPFGKVPALVLDDGSSLFQSNTICEYFDHLGGGALYPADWNARLNALRLLAYSDNILDACILQRMEQLFHEDTRSEKLYARQDRSIGVALDELETEADSWGWACDVGLVSVAVALSYRDFRFADHDWRGDHPALADWYGAFRERPSMQATELEA